jgi:hypothetical protein
MLPRLRITKLKFRRVIYHETPPLRRGEEGVTVLTDFRHGVDFQVDTQTSNCSSDLTPPFDNTAITKLSTVEGIWKTF